MDLYTCGPIGYETARALYEAEKKAYEAVFPPFYLREFEKLTEETVSADRILDIFCIEKNTKNFYSRKNFYFDGSLYLREIGAGGLFGALWAGCEDMEMIRKEEGKKGTVGCRILAEKIPVDQHVTELLEYAGENPFEVSSKGSWLVLSEEEPEGFVRIGTLTEQAERILFHKGHPRFLTPPLRQEKDIRNRQRYGKETHK